MSRKKNNKKEEEATVNPLHMESEEEIEETEELTSEAEEEEAEAGQISVEICAEVYEKVMHWIQKAKGEVSGLGKIEMVNGVFRVTSACLIQQKNTGASTEMTAEAIGKAMFELKDEPGHLNWWWHSHVDFSVFWSGTDMDTIHELGKHGWFLSTVLNKAEDKKTAYYQKGNNFLPQMFVDDVPTSIVYMPTEDQVEEWDKEFDDKVEEVTYTYDASKFPSRSNIRGFSWDEEEGDFRGNDFLDDPLDYEGFGHGGRFYNYDDEDMDEFKESMMDEYNYTEEEINQMILDEIGRQEAATTPKKGRRRKKS